jgi:hypothetical protein
MDGLRARLPILTVVPILLSVALATGCSGGGGSVGPASPPTTPAASPTSAPSGAPTATPRPTSTPTPTPAPSATPTATPTGAPTATPPSSAGVGAYVTSANVGINVEGVVDYSLAQPFVDAIRQSRPWGNPSSPYDQAVAQAGKIDANGWPTVDAGVLVLCCVDADGSAADPGSESLLTGTYQLSFTGKATVAIPIGSGTVAGYAYDASSNTSTAQVTFSNTGSGSGYALYLSFTNSRRTSAAPSGSGVTNVRLIRPQFAPNGMRWWASASQTFTDPFLATLSGYSTLRFMDWAATNNSPVVNWADRTAGTYATAQRQIAYNGSFQPTGASWEDAIALANQTGEDMWINVPAMATDDYVMQLATLLRTSLHSNLHVYVEYSNEVWNGIFAQFQYNLTLAESQAQSNPAYKANCSPSDQYRWGQCRVADRLRQIANDFAAVDGRAALGTTIRPVFATQEDQTYDLGGALNFIAKTYGAPKSIFYGVAQAPYWEGDQSLENQSDTQELQGAETSLQATVPSSTVDFTAYAVAYGLHNFTYEGGPGMSGTPSLAAKVAANLEPQIGSQVTEALHDFFIRGGDMFVYYNDTSAYGQYGMWGTTEDAFNRATPKITAIQSIRGTSQVRSAGVALPGAITGTKDQFEVSSGGYAATNYFYFRNGEELAYLVEAPAAGTYALTLTVGSYASTPGHATIALDGSTIGTLATPATGGNPDTQATTAALPIALPQGLSIVDVAETSGEFGLYRIAIATSEGPGPSIRHVPHRP